MLIGCAICAVTGNSLKLEGTGGRRNSRLREVGLFSTNDKRINILDRDPEFPYVSCWFVPASGMEVARIGSGRFRGIVMVSIPQIAISWKRE